MNKNDIFNLNPHVIRYAEETLGAKYIPYADVNDQFGEKENKFLEFVTKKLKYPIGYFLKNDLHANMSNYYIPNTCHIVAIKEIPQNEIALLEICHELGHCYLGTVCYPYVIGDEKIPAYYKTIASNVIQDPLINKILFSYKMDVVNYMLKAIQAQVGQLVQCPDEKNLSTLDHHYFKCLLIEKLLEWRIIHNAIPNSFETVAKNKMPIILKESKDFVKRMDIVGTGKPQKCNMLLSELLSENGVSDILEVTDIWRN